MSRKTCDHPGFYHEADSGLVYGHTWAETFSGRDHKFNFEHIFEVPRDTEVDLLLRQMALHV